MDAADRHQEEGEAKTAATSMISSSKIYQNGIRSRARLILLAIMLALAGLIVRLLILQVGRHDYYRQQAARQHWSKKKLAAQRGEIYDRNGKVLAISVPGYSCYADPKLVKDPQRTARILASLLSMDIARVQRSLSHPRRRFVWIKRLLSTEKSLEIKSHKLAGIYFRQEPRRVYPYGTLAAHIIGFVGMDHQGLEGIEASFNKELMGEDGFTWVLKDGRLARPNIYLPQLPWRKAKDGGNIYLTIDIDMQHLVEAQLAQVMARHRALGAAVVVLEVNSGDILALASQPTYNPNDFRSYSPQSWRNKAIADAFELGSVMKPLILAAALSERVVTVNSVIDCGNGACRIIPGRTLHDSHSYGLLTAAEVIIKSSNIGTAKIGMRLGATRICNYLHRLGLGSKTGVELPGEAAGILKPARRWSDFTLTSVPMGHEICVTPLQMAAAYTTLAGDGIYRPPSIVRSIVFPDKTILHRYQPSRLDQIYSRAIARTMQTILRQVVEQGTAKQANLQGVEVAGKTGTAQKLQKGGGYSHHDYIAAFVGFAPAANPELCTLVMVDNPKNGHSGGRVAAPVVATILRDILSHRKLTAAAIREADRARTTR